MQKKGANMRQPERLERGHNHRSLWDAAEEKLTRSSSATPARKTKILEALIHELQVHQVELEMQNEKLRRVQGKLEALQKKYFGLYDLAPVGYFTLSEKGMILEANLTATRLLGVTKGTLAMQPLARFILPEDQNIYYRHRKKLFETGAPHACELRILRADADPFWARIEATVAQDTESGDALCRAIMSDITNHNQKAENIKILAEVSDISPVSIIVHDFEGNFLYANQKTFNLHGYSEDEFLTLKLHEIDTPASARLIEARMQRLVETGEALFEVEHYRQDGTSFPLEVFAKVTEWGGKKVILSVASDITERRRYQESLENVATHDHLTGLLNRYSLEEMLNRTIAKAKRGVVSSLLYMDLDNFKEVNDTVGHSVGDDVLITFAGLMKAAMRMEDIVFRLGGDEFAVLLDGMDSEEALNAAERLRAAAEGCRFELEGRIFPLTLSIGLIEIDGALTMRELLSESDAAMYRAKGQGKNRVVIASEKGKPKS
jgi:diguanylate cyclase (GGDEF)-like protein/PAS domain S-box-containing protein